MSFLAPLFLIGVLGAVLPIVLHFTLRGRAPRLAFSDVRFLERAFVHRDRRRRLREWLLLALRIAAIVLLALAFARPLLDATESAPEDPAAPAGDGIAGDAAPVVTPPLGPSDPTGVLVVVNGGTREPGALYLSRALDAAPPEQPFDVRVVAPDGVAAVEREVWDTIGVVAVVGTDGLSRPGRARIAQFVGEGGGLLLVAGPDVDPRLVVDLLGPSATLLLAVSEDGEDDVVRRVAVADPRHPIFRPFGDSAATLGQVQFTGVARVSLPSAQVLARFDDAAPALIEYNGATGRAVVFASDLNDAWNDFPRRPSFVPFVHEALRYLERPRSDAPAPDLSQPASEPVPIAADQDAEQALWWYAIAAMALVLVGELCLGRTMV